MKTHDEITYSEDVFNSNNYDVRSTLRADNELFNDEASTIVYPVINVKRINSAKNTENWQILVNGKVVLLLKGTRFTTAEKKYLKTVEGMKFLISEYKNGKKSVIKIKEELKRVIE